VTIYAGRRTTGLGLDRSGFELIAHKSSLGDWESFSDAEIVKAVDYPEVTVALKRRTGASKVVIFDHTLRDSTAPPGRAALREPVRRVHDDQTFRSAPDRVHKHLPPKEAAWRLQRRFAVINFWRSIGGRVQRALLAVCDARTIKPDDLIPSDLVYPDWTGETYAFAFSPLHRWYWYPQQSPREATLLKIYDSATDGQARLTAQQPLTCRIRRRRSRLLRGAALSCGPWSSGDAVSWSWYGSRLVAIEESLLAIWGGAEGFCETVIPVIGSACLDRDLYLLVASVKDTSLPNVPS
jgi:hypothetical protein